jgi:hypothetical protein
MRRAVPGWSLALALAAGCAATGRDPWRRAQEVFRDGDVAGFVDVRRKQRDVTLAWCGVRSEGERRLTSVRMILFTDVNGDLTPQSEEQIAVWNTQSPTPVTEFWVNASFRSSNVPAEVLEHLSVSTEVMIDGLPEPLRQVRKLP